MKAVLESLQSFLGRFHEDKKPSSNLTAHADDTGYGASGFTLLIGRSKPKKIDRQEKPLSRKGHRKPCCRRLHVHSLIAPANSEPNPSCSDCFMSPIKPNSPPASAAAGTESICDVAAGTESICDQSMGLGHCLVKMCRRRGVARKHADEAFDKYTSEYYSCGGKKGMQNCRLACEIPNLNHIGGGNVSADSSTSDSDASESSCGEGNVFAQLAQPIRRCGVSWRPTEKSCADRVQHGEVSGLSIIVADNKALIDNFCNCISEVSPILSTIDDRGTDVEEQKMGVGAVFPSVPTEKRDHMHDRSSECDAGFCSQQHEYDEEESSWASCATSAYCSSPARGNLSRKFPPPLNMLALQSYPDKRGQSPEACAAGYCLRSYRQDGRFVLQEVRAPTHKYFRVLRQDGRLKFDIINAVDDSSQEDDAGSAPDTCQGEHVGMHAFCDEMKMRAGSNTGCARTHNLTSTPRANVGLANPSEQDELAAQPEIQTNLEGKVSTAVILRDVGASADERIPRANPMFAKDIGDEDMVSPLTEPLPSPRCPEMTTLYGGGTSANIKRSWVRPISAF